MKNPVLTILLLAFLSLASSCADKKNTKETESQDTTETNHIYKQVEASKVASLNQRIKEQGVHTEEAIMQLYAPKAAVAEGKYTYTITPKKIDSNHTQLTLVEEGILDDSLTGLMVVMNIEKSEGTYKVTAIKEAYKCWKGRGNENWNPEKCH